MNRLSTQHLIIFLVVLLSAHLILLFPVTSTFGAFLLITVLPGWLWATALCPPRSPLLQITLTTALSYTFTNLITLLLHYFPGPLFSWQLLAALDTVTLLPLIKLYPFQIVTPDFRAIITSAQFSKPNRSILYGLILLPAIVLRLMNLGYSEFQGDEALVMISAAEALSGHEDALFLRSKGPAEVLLPMAMWRLTDTINEATARLPFAFATLGAMMTLYLIGSRLTSRGNLALFAAAFLGYNGFMVAFGRIIQYQGMVVWFSSLAFLMLIQWRESRQYRWVFCGGLFLGSGLLAHYDAILILPALLWLGWSELVIVHPHPNPLPLGEGATQPPSLWGGLRGGKSTIKQHIIAAILFICGILLIAAPFYLPYSLDPQANRTGDYVGERIGQELRNNLPAFFHFNSFYSSFYTTVITSLLVLIGLLWLIKRPRWLTIPLTLVIMTVVFFPHSFQIQSLDLAILPFALLAFMAWLSLPLASIEQALIIWLAVPFLGYNFVVALGLTHIYTIVPAWSLLAALTVDKILEAKPLDLPHGQVLKWGIAIIACGLSTLFLWNNFIRHDVEYRQDYPQGNLALFWTPYDELPQAGFFGFAHRAGWKAIGQAIQQGDLAGDYGSNEEPEITTWYTRGAARACDPQPEFYFVAEDVIDPIALPDDVLKSAYSLVGQIRLANGKVMQIQQRQPTPLKLGELDEATLAAKFDQTAWPESFARSGRGANSANVNFKNLVKLIGYDVDARRAYPNGRVSVTLYWQALTNIPTSYQVFVHLEGEHGLAAQADGVPVCWTYPTDVWRPGQIIADQHAIPLPADMPATSYRLEVGWYLPSDFTRLDWLDEAGNPAGTSVTLDTITVKKTN